MDIFSIIKKLLRSTPAEPDLIHDFFGPLHSEAVGDEDDFWQAELIFEPTGEEICINIIAGLEGPTESHVNFYVWFLENYESEFDRVSVSLINEFEAWFQKEINGPFLKNFEFSSLTIPKNGDINNFWEISFECMAEPNQHLFTVQLKENQVQNVCADG
ncbi:hypothetical protein NMZ99_002008 [Vibrio parahaemolyticus]|uniref:hypothetical protein n=1 Tax=Vibrio parahaemolyticus TaxID=670 RepID=UPI00061A99B0|nr:hypothetical protein [Vibrio parahaemolyticus]EJG1164640.1 hypothetical protein [Vibrio parahaemolyticus]EJL8302048.1 hypothetical protein [Vibrio parahaemolyticus]EJU9846270.1 hypothetical protein [Vibrio parahaemolyticus]KKC90827.1 hypothetical protein WR36_03720 [Vibrio parahaemolyticus]HAS6589525.1 hypothetical protein [Vibrio parahaemolyticus]